MFLTVDSHHLCGLSVPFLFRAAVNASKPCCPAAAYYFLCTCFIVLIFRKLNDLLIDYLSIFYVTCFYVHYVCRDTSLIYLITDK